MCPEAHPAREFPAHSSTNSHAESTEDLSLSFPLALLLGCLHPPDPLSAAISYNRSLPLFSGRQSPFFRRYSTFSLGKTNLRTTQILSSRGRPLRPLLSRSSLHSLPTIHSLQPRPLTMATGKASIVATARPMAL